MTLIIIYTESKTGITSWNLIKFTKKKKTSKINWETNEMDYIFGYFERK